MNRSFIAMFGMMAPWLISDFKDAEYPRHPEMIPRVSDEDLDGFSKGLGPQKKRGIKSKAKRKKRRSQKKARRKNR